MKGILVFLLPEDSEEFKLAQKGSLYKYALDDLDNWLRSKAKYEDIEQITITEVRNKIAELYTDIG